MDAFGYTLNEAALPPVGVDCHGGKCNKVEHNPIHLPLAMTGFDRLCVTPIYLPLDCRGRLCALAMTGMFGYVWLHFK